MIKDIRDLDRPPANSMCALWTPGAGHTGPNGRVRVLIGEVVRRTTGTSLGSFFAQEIASRARIPVATA
jgi:hypothetical protein